MPTDTLSDKLTKCLNEKKSARDFQVRKQFDWNENYELYRNKVKTNRLTQRQSVNIPLMKETIQTLLSGEDDAPDVEWKENSGDQMKEIIYQEMWNDFYRRENLELKDMADKKNELLYGLSTKKLNLDKEGVCLDVMDTFDIVYDPLTKPLDIESARFITHQNIYKSLREILVDPNYTAKGKSALKFWLASDKGIVQSGKNKVEMDRRNERLRIMGLQNDKFPLFAGGDVIVNCTEHFTNIWDPAKKAFVRHVVVFADDVIELSDALLTDLIGIHEWPFEFWASDPETNDIYPDGVADIVRPANKIINIWYSQQIENRTIQNFQMHWFDATQQGYQPQTYEPGPGRMLPAPGDPNKTLMPVQINALDETFTAINFVTNIVERATGATALEKGTPEQGAQTLGEIQILVGKATERSKSRAKFYKHSWYRTAKKWNLLMQANRFPKISLYKTGPDGKVYEKVVYTKDWHSAAGYEPTVASSSEQEADEVKTIQKFGYVIAQNPQNAALKKIAQSRQLKLLDLTPAELKEIEDEEQKMADMAQQQAMAVQAPMPGATPGAPAPAPQGSPLDMTHIQDMIGQLTQ